MRLLASLVVVLCASQTALADGAYVTESFGGTDVKDELSAQMGSAVRVRAAIGYRRKNLAFEMWFAGGFSTDSYVQHDPDPPSETPSYEIGTPDSYHGGGNNIDGPDGGGYYPPSRATTLASYGLDVKYLQAIAPNLEVYIKGGISKGFVDGIDASGRGLGAGAGIQLKGKVPALGFLFWPLFFTGLGPKVTAAIYADTSYEFYRLHGPRGGFTPTRGTAQSTDAQLNHMMVGFAVGSDF